ncbi:SdpI family protein [Microbacterium candidum]|uniref:SdpI family protein n=1 Tax=Microbacterium candidum TaxID=3041922 RepID=A0ABT7MUC9_9MICO|nr:SdpI family protein [Microbacterium sp. ASV49]MDL9978049.1 SdpI family protein [Microbacterium sp. ASV49]
MSVWGAVILVVAAYVVVLLIVLCGRGVIKVNGAVGLRVPALMASEGAWEAGHRAAVAPTIAGALVATLFLSAATLMTGMRDIVVLPVLLALVGGVAWGAVIGSRAAGDAPAELPAKPDPYSLSPDPPVRELASEHITHSGGLIPAAMLSWLPAIVLVIARITAHDLPAIVPIHWGPDGPDNWAPVDAAFWFAFAFAVGSAVGVTAFVVFVGDDLPVLRGALGLGTMSGTGTLVGLQWILEAHISSDPAGIPDYFVLVPPALLFGAVVGAVSAIRHAPPPRMSDGSDSGGGPADVGNSVDG